MITVLPECSLPVFTNVVFLTGSAGNQLERIRDDIAAAIIEYKQVNMLCEVRNYGELPG